MSARRGPLDGAANNAAGLKWQRACAVYLRDHGWPLAASASRGIDLVAGPVGLDATIREWDHLLGKLDRHMAACAEAGLPVAAIWKKRNRRRGVRGNPGDPGSVDPGRGVIQVQADQFLGLVLELEAAARRASEAELGLERWMARERAG